MLYRIYRRKISKRYKERWIKTNWHSKTPEPLIDIIEDIKSKRKGVFKYLTEYVIKNEM